MVEEFRRFFIMSDFLSPRQVAAQWFYRLWTEHDGSVIAELMAEGARAELEGGQITTGPGEFAVFFNTLLGTFPDISVKVLDIVEEGERAYVRWEASGTHEGGAMGLTPTKCAHGFRGITWMTVRGGKITEGGDSWNQAGLIARMSSAVPA